MTDAILIKDLSGMACIGVYEWERKIRQKIVVDLQIETDLSAAARSDVLKDTLDYAAVASSVLHVVENSEYFLIEALAQAVFRELFASFDIGSITLELHKPDAVPRARDTSIRMTRSRQAFS